ncbi:MAG: TauD/TfdA family dioxygenase [Rhodospirillales bacterium]
MPDTNANQDTSANDAVTFKHLKPLVGSEVLNVDLTRPMSDATFARIRKEMCERGALVIRGQSMTPEQHIAFSRRFGALEHHVLNNFCLADHPEIFVVSNIMEGGKHVGAYDGSKTYHIDLSYMQVPSLGSVFYCLEHPPIGSGGETSVINMSAVYEALPEEKRTFFAGRGAVHDYVWNYERVHTDRPPLTEEQKQRVPPVTHPAVCTHPETGRDVLYIDDNFFRRFEGTGDEESREIVEDLIAFADQDQFRYVHAWTPGDVLIWDNRSSIHKRLPFDTENTRRLMHRTTIIGEKPFHKAS